MLHKVLPANPTLIDRWGFFMFWLFEGMALHWRRRGLRHVHQAEINRRLLGLWGRLRSVLGRYRAGTLRAPRARAAGEVTPPPSFGPLRSPNPQGEGEHVATAAQKVEVFGARWAECCRDVLAG
jgi:hypothetical protein